MASTYRHIFLSYSHGDKADVSKLRDELIAAHGDVWWDQVILPGQDGDMEIQRALKESYVIVICLSKKALAREESGIYPEARDAIKYYRRYKPGSIFLIPVRLDECDIPPIKIDETLTLSSIQYVDLFPASERARGVQRLIEAIRKAPNHP